MLSPSISYKLHIFTLAAFAFAQPLYDLLGKNAEFFPVRNNDVADILVLILFLSLLIPAAIVIIVETARLFSQRAWEISHIAILTLLATIIALPVINSILATNTAFTLGIVCIASITFIYLYINKPAIRLFLTYLSPAILIFPLLFVFNSQVYHLVFKPRPPQLEITEIKSETPIVMIIFDELPVSTLMSGKYQIDEKLFPGFASLAETATWYPNTATVAEYTLQAIPALLTGNLPPEKKNLNQPKNNLIDWLDIPSFESYPKNLFTALGSSYELRVFETVSRLCPETLCSDTENHQQNLAQRLHILASDLFIVYLHIILPQDAAATLPRIDLNWSDFFGNNLDDIHDDLKVDDVNRFERFIESLTPSRRPTLYFHHTTFPHRPWKYLPSGKEYVTHDYIDELTPESEWTEHANLREPYQRHLLQTMFADRLLSKALNKLETEGLFDDAIIIVTSDHGASFKHGENFRRASQYNYADIMDVPLFIKHPNQRTASVNISQLQSIDIISLVFDALGETYPWVTDGHMPFKDISRAHTRLPIFSKKGEAKYIKYDPDKKFETVKWKTGMFGTNGVSGIYGSAEYAHLIGQPINNACGHGLKDVRISGSSNGHISIKPASGKAISSIKIEAPESSQAGIDTIAISVNSKIAAILPKSSFPGSKEFVHTMIDEQFLKPGNNTISINTVKSSGECNDLKTADK